jgi:hypothetical protein
MTRRSLAVRLSAEEHAALRALSYVHRETLAATVRRLIRARWFRLAAPLRERLLQRAAAKETAP